MAEARRYPNMALTRPQAAIRVAATLGLLITGLSTEARTLQQAEPSASKVADAPFPISVSPDNRFLVQYGNRGNLAIRDLETGETRALTNADYPQLVMSAVVSPNGDQIAYAWHNEHDFDDLRLIHMDGSGETLLFRDADVRSVRVKDWTEDGSQVLVTVVRFDSTAEVAYVPVDGGAPRPLRSLGFEEQLPQAMAVSPNGQFIAYDASTGPDGSDHDIYLMTGDGSASHPIVQHPADDRLLAWSPDGEGILFASDRRGSVDIWLVSVSDGVLSGDPHLLKRDVGKFTPVGLARDGSYYFGVTHYDSHLYIANLDHDTGRLGGSPRIVAPALHRSGVEWSPDGRYLAYARPGGGVLQDSWVLVVRSPDTSEEREFTVAANILHGLRPSWSPDGKFLLFQGWERGAYPREGVYTVRVETGEVTTLFTSESVWDRLIDWVVWSADGQALFFTDQAGDSNGIVMRDLMSGLETDLLRDVWPPWVSRLAPSPDGRFLALGIYDTNNRKDALAVMSLPDSERRVLLEVPLPTLIWPSAWTPDSRYLIYLTDGVLWRISPEGGEPEEVGRPGAETYRRFMLSVHPNGHSMAFIAETGSRPEVWRIENLLPPR
jgi:Tol biopolymer transport system component